MKTGTKYVTLPAIAFLLIVVGALVVRFWPRTVLFDQCSDLYKHYAEVEGIDATFIKDFKVNDTVFVDVTLLEAMDSIGWTILEADFDLVDLTPELQQFISNGDNLIFTKLIPKRTSHITSSVTYKDDLLAISYLTKTISVFHIKNDAEKHAVKYHNYDKSTNQ